MKKQSLIQQVKKLISVASKKCKIELKIDTAIPSINKAEHAVQSYTARKGNITALSKTLQTRAMQSNAKHRCP